MTDKKDCTHENFTMIDYQEHDGEDWYKFRCMNCHHEWWEAGE